MLSMDIAQRRVGTCTRTIDEEAMNEHVATLALMLTLAGGACAPANGPAELADVPTSAAELGLAKYIEVSLEPDLSGLSDNQRAILRLLIDAAQAVDEIFWMQACGDRAELLEHSTLLQSDDLSRLISVPGIDWTPTRRL